MNHRRPPLLLLCLLTCTFSATAAELEAHLEWAKRTALATPLSGIIERIHVTPGERVTAGTPLLQLEARELRAALEAARAALAYAEQQRQEAQREEQRAQELYDRTLLSDHELHLAQIAAARANSVWQQARAQLTRAEVQVQQATLRAPFDALVIDLPLRPGEAVSNQFQTTPLAVIAASGHLLAVATVDAEQANRLQLGDPASVRLGTQQWSGQISQIGLEPLNDSGYRLVVEFPLAAQSRVRAGQAVIITLP